MTDRPTDRAPPPEKRREDMTNREILLAQLDHLEKVTAWRFAIDERLEEIMRVAGLTQGDRDKIAELEDRIEDLERVSEAPNGHSFG